MRSHFEGTQFEQTEAQPETLRRIKLVDAELGAMRVSSDIDEQVAEQSIHNERRAAARRQMAKGNLQLKQSVHPGLVHPPKLARRARLTARKQIQQPRRVRPES